MLKFAILGTAPEIESIFRSALEDTLRTEGLPVIAEADVKAKLAREPGLTSCLTRSCFARLSLALGGGVQWVAVGEVQRPQRSSYSVKLQLRDLSTGQFLGVPIDEQCEICGTEEARRIIVSAAQRLARLVPESRTDRGPATGVLELSSQPSGAKVFLDGVEQTDRAPSTFLLGIGVHRVELSLAGYRSVRRPIEISPGQRVQVNLELPAIPKKRPWLTALTVLSGIGAAGAIATSGVLFAFDGKPAYNRPEYAMPCGEPQLHCPLMYNNTPQAGALMALGGALTLGMAVGIYYTFATPSRTSAARGR